MSDLSQFVGGGFKNFIEYTASDTFVVPSGIYTLRVLLQGAGGSGGQSSAGATTGTGGGGAGNTLIGYLPVQPAQSLSIVVGATASGGNQAGDTYIEMAGVQIALAKGGDSVTFNSASAGAGAENFGAVMPLNSATAITGRRGGTGQPSTAGLEGVAPYSLGTGSTASTISFSNAPIAVGGTTDGARGGGGSGANSYFGTGGVGGNGTTTANVSDGGNSPNYGAGGGGAGENTTTGGLAGAGGDGVLQLWY